jgi:hypothetical protein
LEVDWARVKFSVLAGSFIVGLAIFPLLVRQVRRLADYVSGEEIKRRRNKTIRTMKAGETSRDPWNLLHVFSSFTTGFFVNLVYEKVVEIIRTQIR